MFLQDWSVRPCVRPLLMRRTWAAGHNAFRGIGSRPIPRARSALAIVGFPVSPVSTGLLHYTLFALPNSVDPAPEAFRRRAIPALCKAWPLVMMAQIIRAVLLASASRRDLCRAARHQLHQPRPASTMPFGVADHGHRADDQHSAQIAVSLLCNTSKPFFAAAGVLARNKTDPCSEVPATSEMHEGRERSLQTHWRVTGLVPRHNAHLATLLKDKGLLIWI